MENTAVWIILPVLISFAISAVTGPFVIRTMVKLKASQTERKEGVQSHLKKAGTPTMGGISILISFIVTTCIYMAAVPECAGELLPVLVLTVGFGAIGFLDDFLKVVLRRSDGLLPWQKLLLQFAVATVFLLLLIHSGTGLEILLPFTGGKTAKIGWVAYPLFYIAVLATVNGVNFTDGLDGLASSVTIVTAIFWGIVSVILGVAVTPAAGAVVGALMGFLLYNAYPAKIFMGDTGSLALGGFVAGIAYMTRTPLFILIAGFIYALELVSVVLQVTYFKATHGKRIFKMTPIHHHFELSGWSETRIVAVFTIVTALLCMVSLIHFA